MDPAAAIPGILSIVRRTPDPAEGRVQLLAHCSKQARASLWKRLPHVDVARDVAEAVRWLREELHGRVATTGVYLGLDTLNMDGGRGANVEIGGSLKADPSTNELDWMYGCAWYGKSHLIQGLFEMHGVYSKEKPELFSFADYVLFLGYSGLVLASAIEVLEPPLRAGSKGRLFAWGFHDGDLFPLSRATERKTRRLAEED